MRRHLVPDVVKHRLYACGRPVFKTVEVRGVWPQARYRPYLVCPAVFDCNCLYFILTINHRVSREQVAVYILLVKARAWHNNAGPMGVTIRESRPPHRPRIRGCRIQRAIRPPPSRLIGFRLRKGVSEGADDKRAADIGLNFCDPAIGQRWNQTGGTCPAKGESTSSNASSNACHLQ